VSELLKKELRALRPMALLIVAVLAAMFIYSMVDEFPDMTTSSSRESEATGMLMLIGLFSAMTGAGLLVSESNEGTLLFLDGLPLSRTRIFFSKVIAGLAVLGLIPLLGCGLDILSLALTHQSTSPPFHWDTARMCFVQGSIVAIYLLSLATALSFVRQWFTLVVGFVVWGFLWLRVNEVAWTALFDPYQLLTCSIDDAQVRFPWHHAAAAMSVSFFSLALAWFSFQSLGDRMQYAAQRVRRWRMATVLRFIGIALVPVVWISVVGKLLQLTRSNEPKTAHGIHVEKSFAYTQTKRFDFVFRESQRKQAESLIATADAIHDRVTGYLGASFVPGRIVADLGSPVVAHAAGQATWTKIRVPLGLGLSTHELQAVLGHETTHVYIEQLSNGAMFRHFSSTRFFHEGLATFVEHKFFSTPEECEKMRRLAAVAASRGTVPFETLASNKDLSKERDGNLVYPLGEIFCHALVSTYGDGAPGKLLRAFGRPNAPTALEGAAFWRDAMQSCGFNLDCVIAAYDTEVSRAITEQAAFIEKFPKLTAHIELAAGEIIIRPEFKGAAPGNIVCMIEPSFGIRLLTADADGSIRIPRSNHPGPRLRYTLGWESEKLRWPLFETWSETEL
jgi:hypothetical protein